MATGRGLSFCAKVTLDKKSIAINKVKFFIFFN
jgi:hypothetical protein